MAESAVDALGIGEERRDGLFGCELFVGRLRGPRVRAAQPGNSDVLVRLDKDLGELFAHLDQKVGRGNYVVALTADHGVAPTPEDMQKTGVSAGLLSTVELRSRLEKALEPFHVAHRRS